MRTEIDKAYLAGFLDGEGSICITGMHAYLELYANLTNTHLSSLLQIQEKWGGNLYKKKGKLVYKQGYELRWIGGKAGKLLQELLPYLVVKQEQAKIGLRFIASRVGSGYHLTQETLNIRLALREELKQLNKRGSPLLWLRNKQ